MLISDIEGLYKFGSATPEDHPWVFGNTWAIEHISDTERLVVAPATNYIEVLKRLTELMPEPMWLLYVLIVPRGGGNPGRYQSCEPQSREQVRQFLQEFKTFLETDGRHNLWIRSVTGSAMLVYNRHNLIYGYGYLEDWKPLLSKMLMSEVRPASIEVPDPHSHHYHAPLDVEETRLLSYLDWHHTPLREQDER